MCIHMCVYVYIHTNIHIYIYIYIYAFRKFLAQVSGPIHPDSNVINLLRMLA